MFLQKFSNRLFAPVLLEDTTRFYKTCFPKRKVKHYSNIQVQCLRSHLSKHFYVESSQEFEKPHETGQTRHNIVIKSFIFEKAQDETTNHQRSIAKCSNWSFWRRRRCGRWLCSSMVYCWRGRWSGHKLDFMWCLRSLVSCCVRKSRLWTKMIWHKPILFARNVPKNKQTKYLSFLSHLSRLQFIWDLFDRLQFLKKT